MQDEVLPQALLFKGGFGWIVDMTEDMYWPQKIGRINKKIFIGKEFGIEPDSFRLILVLYGRCYSS